jgi:hypothetical protein
VSVVGVIIMILAVGVAVDQHRVQPAGAGMLGRRGLLVE